MGLWWVGVVLLLWKERTGALSGGGGPGVLFCEIEKKKKKGLPYLFTCCTCTLGSGGPVRIIYC